ncbi:hypothetical protein Btru_069512 [Bulinus truncatus]|nr:hypothetical protein Btru_069512 [Bulinus truncatus]
MCARGNQSEALVLVWDGAPHSIFRLRKHMSLTAMAIWGWMCTRFFKHGECSDVIIGQCKGEVVYATQIFKLRQQYICPERFIRTEKSALEKCAIKTNLSLSRCTKARNEKLEEVNYLTQASSMTHPWCNHTDTYIRCVYTVMALACKPKTAEKYMENFNLTSTFVDAVNGYGCSFIHPLDRLKTTALPPDTTSLQQYSRSVSQYGGRQSSGSGRSTAASSRANSQTLLRFCCLLVLYRVLFFPLG